MIKQTPTPTSKESKLPEGSEQKPLLQISLPAPESGNPMAPLPIGKHNAAAQKNFKEVADLFFVVINNQKAMSKIIVEQGKLITNLTKNNVETAKSIRKLLKEENRDDDTNRN